MVPQFEIPPVLHFKPAAWRKLFGSSIDFPSTDVILYRGLLRSLCKITYISPTDPAEVTLPVLQAAARFVFIFFFFVALRAADLPPACAALVEGGAPVVAFPFVVAAQLAAVSIFAVPVVLAVSVCAALFCGLRFTASSVMPRSAGFKG